MNRLPLVRTAVILLRVASLAVAFEQPTGQAVQASPNKLIVGYYTAFNGFDDENNDGIDDVPGNEATQEAAAALDGSKYSILIYGFLGISGNSCTKALVNPNDGKSIVLASEADNVVKGLKDNNAENSTLKVLLSIGGGGYKAKFEAITDYTAFALSCYDLMISMGADGLDVDYEFPETTAGTTQMNNIMLAMHNKLGNNGSGTGTHILTMGAAASSYYGQWMDAPKLKTYVDYFTTMAYNYHGTWETTINYNSPSTGCSNTSEVCATSTAYYWNTTRGVAKSKILLGIGFYGHKYTPSSGNGCSVIPGTTGYSASSYEIVSYRDLRTKGILNGSGTAGNGWTRSYNSTVQNASLCQDNGSTQNWIGYEDPTSAAWRAQWIKDNSYPGIMIWEIGYDYNNEMIKEINNVFAAATNLTARPRAATATTGSGPTCWTAWVSTTGYTATGTKVSRNGKK